MGGGHVGYAAENLEEERGDSSFHRVGFVEEGGGNLSDDDTYSGLQKNNNFVTFYAGASAMLCKVLL